MSLFTCVGVMHVQLAYRVCVVDNCLFVYTHAHTSVKANSRIEEEENENIHRNISHTCGYQDISSFFWGHFHILGTKSVCKPRCLMYSDCQDLGILAEDKVDSLVFTNRLEGGF